MKKILAVLILFVIATAGFIGWLFLRMADAVPILNYHRVDNSDNNPSTLKVADFEAQIKFLVDSGYSFVMPEQLVDARQGGKPLPKNPVIICFDDGHDDIYRNVFPVLQKYNVRATVFIVTDHIGMKDFLTWEQVRQLQAGGFVDFESHTKSYKDLTKLRGDKLWDQIYGAKQAIEWALKKPSKFISFPEGKYTVDAEETAKELNYRAGFIEDYGLTAGNKDDGFVLTRIPVQGSNPQTLLRFKLRLKGAPIFSPLNRLKKSFASDGNESIADLIWIP
ncbi:MAG: polysaccharide deacetylase family protein [Selenomonadaceae bacterium]|nr:polysaccharide deacetylase family protein [Selenomonadaceae bacterium]